MAGRPLSLGCRLALQNGALFPCRTLTTLDVSVWPPLLAPGNRALWSGRSTSFSRPTPQNYFLNSRATRNLTSSSVLHKKGGKTTRADSSAKGSVSKDDSSTDPLDFAELQAGLAKAQNHLKEELSKLRAGGRFNPETLENIRVNVVKGSKDTERIADLAQVVPRGRVLNVIIGDKDVRAAI